MACSVVKLEAWMVGIGYACDRYPARYGATDPTGLKMLHFGWGAPLARFHQVLYWSRDTPQVLYFSYKLVAVL